MPVLSLDQEVLNKVNIGSVVEEISDENIDIIIESYLAPDDVTEEVHLSRTVGEAKHSLVLSSECDQVLHPGLGTPLRHCSEKLSTLRESNSIVSLLQLWITLYHLTHLPHLPSHGHPVYTDQ